MLARTVAAVSLLAAPALGAVESPGKIDAVTVYRGQALVTRVVDLPRVLPAAAGTVQEIVVTDLPATIRPESLHAESSAQVRVRSVSFRTRPVVQDTRAEVRAIDGRIEEIQSKQVVNARKAALVGENRAYLDSLQGFVAPTATTELTRGVLNADTIEKLSAYLIKQRGALADEELALAADARKLASDLEQAQRERQTLTAGSSRTVFEAVVLVVQEGGAAGSLKLRYLVDGATWEPSYNARAQGKAPRDALTLEYYASIRQMSGEDWNGVAMTLSTATPSLVAGAPRLTPLAISLSAPAPQQAPMLSLGYEVAKKGIEQQLRQVEQQRVLNTQVGGGAGVPGQDGGSRRAQLDAEKDLNRFANDLLVLDLLTGAKIDKQPGAARQPAAPEEGLSVTYTIDTRTSLPSRNDRQLIQIAALPLKARFDRVATPALTAYVYEQAEATNTGSMVLLAGPMTAYSDGAFVGSGELPTVAAGQGLTAGLGIDSSLRASRELVERAETTQGGNRVVELTYRLSVENFGEAPATIQLLDRLPRIDDKRSDIRLTLLSAGGELCSDAGYLAGPRKQGILRWDVAVPPQAIGTRAFTVEYKFRLEFDRQMTIIGMDG